MEAINWSNDCLVLLDQTALPTRTEFIECRDYRRVAEAIRRLEVRGAPAIGAAAAFGLVLGARELAANKDGDFWQSLVAVAAELRSTRPTAVNLFWALDRMMSVASRFQSAAPAEVAAALEAEAKALADEDREVNRRLSQHGAALFDNKMAVLTHCNAGALATVAFGTALGVIRQAWAEGRISRVYADETRPLLQGARLTAWEMQQEQIPVTLITDSMAGWVMKKGMVQAVIVGADRIALNGDFANKIGTYSVAVLAARHRIPFYVAAPVSTFDFSTATGDAIPIEERSPDEVRKFGGMLVAPPTVAVFNPAFDVTPSSLVSGIVTEYGVLRPPYNISIEELKQQKGGN